MEKKSDLPRLISVFERAVYRHDYAQGLETLLSILMQLDRGELAPVAASRLAAGGAHARLASAVVALLTAPGLRIPAGTLHGLLLSKRSLLDVLAPSPFDPQAILDLLGDPGGAGRALDLPREKVAQALCVLTLAQLSGFRSALAQMRPSIRMSLLLGLLCDPIVLTRAEERARNWLIDHPEFFENSEMPPAGYPRVASAWMFCSYADHPRRHELKRALNGLIRGWIEKRLQRAVRCAPRRLPVRGSAPVERSGEASVDSRPVMLIITERFRAGHAMHRCYAPSIAQLRARYRVVLMGVKAHLDDASKALADEVFVVDADPRRFPELVARIEAIAPDLIFYPSIGMSFWVIALANLRLAPIQFMSIGHPASSFSDSIDYMVLGRDVLGDPACFTETVVVREAPGNPVQPYPVALPPPPLPRAAPEVVRIAVPAMATKLCPAFLEMCARIEAEAGRPVEFHFFPNRSGVSFRHMQESLSRILPGSVVYPGAPYADYMANLGRCDISLATYPFGNANSTVDSLLLGKPVVALEGDEPAARTDRRMLRLAGAPSWLLASSREQYFDTVLRLVKDDALRVRTSQDILDSDPPRALYETEQALYPSDFADTVDWIYGHHERIQAARRKVWLPEERALVDAAAPASV